MLVEARRRSQASTNRNASCRKYRELDLYARPLEPMAHASDCPRRGEDGASIVRENPRTG